MYIAADLDKCVDICLKTLAQSGSDDWFHYRSYIFNASSCYDAYTYFSNKKPDWENKYKMLFKKSFTGDENTLHGLVCEASSRDKYIEMHQCKCIEIGLLIRPQISWFGSSLDGIVLDDLGYPILTTEIKSPVEGKRLTTAELCQEKAVKSLNADKELKTRHKHNGQVQAGMLIAGVNACDYLVYSKVENNNLEVRVPFDENFTFEMCSTLCKIYFREMLPRLMRDKWADS